MKMNMKKHGRLIALALVVVMSMAMLAACGPTTNEQPAPGTQQANQQPGQQAATPGTTPGTTGGTGGGDAIIAGPDVDVVNFAEAIDIIMDNNMIGIISPLSPGAMSGPSRWAFTLIHDRLVEQDEHGNFIEGLATNWSTEDSQTYTFNLREGVTFHNGDAFTAQDVADTVAMAQEAPGGLAPQAWRNVETVNIIDAHTVELVLSTVDVEFLFSISAPGAGILNRRAVESDAEEGTWIGTGALK